MVLIFSQNKIVLSFRSRLSISSLVGFVVPAKLRCSFETKIDKCKHRVMKLPMIKFMVAVYF